jgi:hypothetical protein
LAELRLMGTFRSDRHRHLVDAPTPPPSVPFDWAPGADDLARLGPQGRAFVASATAAYEHNFLAGELLLEAAATIDQLAALRQEIATTGIVLRNRTPRRGRTRS